MREDEYIYKVRSSLEEDRPEIDFTREDSRRIDWLRIDEVLRGVRSSDDYVPPRVTVEADDGLDWHFYRVPGSFGWFSGEAVHLIGEPAFRRFELFPAFINGARYFDLKLISTLPCFDRARSDVVTYPHDPGRIMDIKQYAFQKDLIEEHTLFCVPESAQLFATASVCRVVTQHGLKGFKFERVA